jgi:hemerythrin superfamily protein
VSSSTDADVIDLLLEQHEQVRQQFILVMGATGQQRVELFAQLVEMLTRHEKTEQGIVHPALATADASAGQAVVDDVMDEEREADRAIEELTSMDAGTPEFDAKLADFHSAVLAHAAHEEEQEFPRIRDLVPAERLVAMAGEVRVAQTAPW